MTAHSYNYRPLEAARKEIRLLEILAVSQWADDVVECRICHASLDGDPKPEYETISYVWGDPTPNGRIKVDDDSILVPTSTEKAIRRMALHNKSRVLWIDSVCINQTDKTEKETQVALMGAVYSSCSGNLIYLGEEASTISRAVANLKELTEGLRDQIGDESSMDVLMIPDRSRADAIENLGVVLDVEALVEFFSRSWFNRLWVIQEAVLAPKSLCICGSSEIDFNIVIQIATYLYEYHAYHIPRELYNIPGLEHASIMWEHRSIRGVLGYVSIMYALGRSVTTQASDLRDKVFGLLGMCGRWASNENVPDLVKPDYNKPLREVFRDATRYTIEGGEYEILSYVSHRSEDELWDRESPSWVPRFDRTRELGEDPAMIIVHAKPPALSDHALSKMKPLLDKEEPNKLIMRGTIFDEIEQVSEILGSPGTTTAIEVALLIFKIHDMARPLQIDDSSIARTLITDTNYRYQQSSEVDCHGLIELLDQINEQPVDTQLPKLEELNADLPDEMLSAAAASVYRQAMSNAFSSRRFAVTKRGRIGLVPKLTRQNDVVAVLLGERTPCVLRPDRDDYKFVGEAYIDGVMDSKSLVGLWETAEYDSESVIRIS